MTFRRGPDAPVLPTRDETAAWEAAVLGTGLPVVGAAGGRARPKLVFGAPLGSGVVGERELVDIFLTERLTIGEVRAALATGLPAGHGLVDLEDVWLGAPGLPSAVVGADCRLELAGTTGPEEGAEPIPLDLADGEALAVACRTLLEATTLPRRRDRGGRATAYDLRPLIEDLGVDPGPPVALRIRVRFDPVLGVGRIDAVIETLEEMVGRRIAVAASIRERLVLRDA